MISPSAIQAKLAQLSRADLESISCTLLSPHFQPVFGSSKLIEHEVAAFRALQRAGLLGVDPVDEFALVKHLRVTRTKARNLLYAVGLREVEAEVNIQLRLQQLLLHPRIHVDPPGRWVSLEVVDPFLMDQVRDFLRHQGFLSDGSFSGAIARMSPQAFAKLLEEAIPPEQRKIVQRNLKDQGIQGKDWSALVIGVIGRIGEQLAGAAGGELGQELAKEVVGWVRTEA